MTDNANPYRPPNEIEPHQSWWSKLRGRFSSKGPIVISRPAPNFAGGEAIICEGIAFFVNLEEPSRLYAASPSTDTSDQRMDFILAEAIGQCGVAKVSDQQRDCIGARPEWHVLEEF
ncbi:hypothetical protein Q31b_45640 [Novipirellula aureliae]|uniref:Uncharacterized protein n=1 Tax=Novipirellula aureliae TaxID=2527966 RepID=A0A5C6DNK7_9BACT|nr:hypothetical protein [Novipirellula aureliae]TWU37775.1 hypothetical protein Q31b_45640 [Novipirellula aureliae]